MKQVPLTLVVALICIGVAEWPTVAAWSEQTLIHHAAVHLLYILAGGLVGMQLAWWSQAAAADTWSETKPEDREAIS